MDQAFKQAEEYRNKAKVLSNVSRIAFIGSIIASAAAVFVPYLLFAFVILVPLALAAILVTETIAIVYRFKARNATKAVITVEDPYRKKEQNQDIATLIALVLFAAIVAYIVTMYLKSFSK